MMRLYYCADSRQLWTVNERPSPAGIIKEPIRPIEKDISIDEAGRRYIGQTITYTRRLG